MGGNTEQMTLVHAVAICQQDDLPDDMRDTCQHISLVREAIIDIRSAMIDRMMVHDDSKLLEPEREGFKHAKEVLGSLEYGSPEYHEARLALGVTLDHHYAHNDHHPEHWPGGWYTMPYTARMEALADWFAATKRMKGGGDLEHSIRHNAGRFGYDERETEALLLTARELGWLDGPAAPAPTDGAESGNPTAGT